jgi:nucleoside 2-deoxyribosyltransferase
MSDRPRAFLTVKYHPDQANRGHIESLLAALEQAGYEPVCVVRDLENWGQVAFDPPALMRATFALLETCAVVVVDLTEKGVGAGIEAGYAHARGLPVLAVAPEECDLSATLQGIATAAYHYPDYPALTTFFRQRLTE